MSYYFEEFLQDTAFIKETHYGLVEGTINTPANLLMNEDVSNHIDMNTDVVYLVNLYIEGAYRGKGKGKELLKDFLTYCKKKHKGKNIMLHAEPIANNSLSKDQLTAFYASYGFKVIYEKVNNNLMLLTYE